MNDYCLLSDFVVTENYIMTCIGINAQCNAKYCLKYVPKDKIVLEMLKTYYLLCIEIFI